MRDEETTLLECRRAMAAFVAARDWERYHRPKNLALSIAIEAGELLEHFQWEDPAPAELTPEQRQAAGEELADVFAYCLSLANALDLDLSAAWSAKMEKNAAKYPPGPMRHHSPPSPQPQ
ncbi:MAG: nucleotide pyrophosphohydrolase [Planctomycetota bacterium]